MSMKVSISKNTGVSVHYYGIITIPIDNYKQNYKWTIAYSKNLTNHIPREVTWSMSPPNHSKTKAEKRIKKLTLELWQRNHFRG